MRNKILFIFISIFLVSCGLSFKEKSEIAVITCNIIDELLDSDDAAMRIREVNLAREKIGEDRYLGDDIFIQKAFYYGKCNDLILGSPNLSTEIEELISKEVEDTVNTLKGLELWSYGRESPVWLQEEFEANSEFKKLAEGYVEAYRTIRNIR